MRSWLQLAVLLPGAAMASEHEVALGATAVVLTNGGSFNNTSPRLALDARYTHAFDTWRLGGGVRWAPRGHGSFPLELYAHVLLSPGKGIWRPAVGPELGISGLPIIVPPTGGYPDDLPNLQTEKLSPVYIAVHAQPLRFIYRSWSVSALEFQWGTPINQPGAALRLQLGLVHIGVAL
ncbi:hypothetical protein [Melittangium boletus]|uniref:Outer membrane protein beta-barrel domain-containing protein n=1 Tax=Melittangium boletus DSM 14713 TaxID=1294270 RepID=A0A250IIQ3_9BACT|nr:hypothetical protein [Melittangium boletus]ATB30806.1 hypothetical protein MEBOL_004268 [Melittangium boletus DSM 14713]